MKVSYIVPLYNKQDYIIDCIESILNEKTELLEIEVCLVDDGSTDNSLLTVMEKYASNPNVKINYFDQNKGKNSACNEAMKMVSGDYICLFGADDVVIRGRTTMLLKEAKDKVGKAIYGGLIAKDIKLENILYKSLPRAQDMYSITISNGLSGGCCLIPRSLCNDLFPIPESLKFEDWWISYILVSMGRVSIINDYVTYYRIGIHNDCGSFGGSSYNNIKKDYIRHLDYIHQFRKLFENKYLDKSEDIRKAFFGSDVKKLIYRDPFDISSVKIILFKIFSAKLIYKILDFIRNLKSILSKSK